MSELMARASEVLISLVHLILAHLNDKKTIFTHMCDQVWRKGVVDDMSTYTYCRSCQTCVISKPQQGIRKVLRKLKKMSVPTYPWQYIDIDFVGPLPESIDNIDGH